MKNLRLAEELCQKYDHTEDYYNILRNNLVVINCVPRIREKSKEIKEESPKLSSLVISLAVVGALLVLVVGVVIYLFKTKKWKLLHKSIFFTFNSSKGKSNVDAECSLIGGWLFPHFNLSYVFE